MGHTFAPTAINMQAPAAGMMLPASPEQADNATMVVPDGQGGCWYWVPDDEEEPEQVGNAGVLLPEAVQTVAYPGVVAAEPMQQAAYPPTAVMPPELVQGV